MPNADLLPTPGDIFAYPSDDPQYYGMTLRDYFAGQALAGLLSSEIFILGASEKQKKEGISISKSVSEGAYEMADAMIAARRPK